MKAEIKQKILIYSSWFIVPYLLIFCLLSLGNVADHWQLPGILIFVAQSIIIVIELLTAFHIVLLLSDVDLSGMEEGFYSFLIATVVIGIAAIPLSFFLGWVLFTLALVLLLYHVGVSIYLFIDKQTAKPVSEENPQEIIQAKQGEGNV